MRAGLDGGNEGGALAHAAAHLVGGLRLHAATLAAGAGCSSVISSGQMRCQSSGRKSRRLTAPEVAASMDAQCSSGTGPDLLLQLLTAD